MSMRQEVLELADGDFAAEVENATGLVLVDFWAPWCGPCRMVAPMVEELAEEYAGRVTFGKLNVDDAPATAGAYGIRSIPTIALFKDGVPVGGVVGVVPKARLSALIDEHLGDAEE
jgi:thioredoxin 1